MLASVERLQKMIPDEEPEMLEMVLLSASQVIEQFCKRDFKKKLYREKISGTPVSKYINLRNYPIHSIEHINVSGYEVLDEGRLYHFAGWPKGDHNIDVEYIGGYVLPGDATVTEPQTLPRSIELACLLLAQTLLRNPGVKSERVGDLSVTYSDEQGLPAAVKALVSPYVGRWV